MKNQGKQVQRSVDPLSSLFDAGDSWFYLNLKQARQIFVSVCSNRLTVAMAMLCAIFPNICQKFDTRRIQQIYRA